MSEPQDFPDMMTDEELGALTRRLIKSFRDFDMGKRALPHEVAGCTVGILMLITRCVRSGATKFKGEYEGVTIPEPVGNWQMTLKRVS